MSMKVEHKVAEVTHKLPEEQARPIVHQFVKDIGLAEQEATLKETDFQALNAPFERLFDLFKQQRADKGEVDFGKFMQEIGQATGSQDRIVDYVGANKKDIDVRVYFATDLEDTNFGFTCSEGGHGVEGPLVAIAVGNLYQTVRIGDAATHIGQLTQMKKGEDITTKFHALIKLTGPDVETAKKTNKFVTFFLSIASFFKNCLVWPIQSKRNTFTTTTLAVGVIAVFMGYLPRETVTTYVDPRNWDFSAALNATTTTLGNLKAQYIG